MYESFTNQQFPIMPKNHMAKLMEKYSFFEWAPVDETKSAARFCTSWATDPKAVDELIEDIKGL
jgi:threonine aldolase